MDLSTTQTVNATGEQPTGPIPWEAVCAITTHRAVPFIPKNTAMREWGIRTHKKTPPDGGEWVWLWADLNCRHHGYEPCALTN